MGVPLPLAPNVDAAACPKRRSSHAAVSLQELVDSVSERSPFVPTDPSNAEQRAARVVEAVGQAVLHLYHQRCTKTHVRHFNRLPATQWDKALDNCSPRATLPSTSAVAMLGTMALGVTREDWPPSEGCNNRPFWYVWTHFPAAKSQHYSSARFALQQPLDETLERFQADMAVQVGFTMDVILDTAEDHSAPVAMVFNPVGAGAFVDHLPISHQAMCLDAILSAIIGEFTRRTRRRECFLFLSGSMPHKGVVEWTNKCGAVAMKDVPDELEGRLFVGEFDCLSLAQALADRREFASVGVTMAADKNGLGNAYLTLRMGMRGPELAAWNAADENNSRRSNLLPWILRINSPHFDWTKLSDTEVSGALRTLKEARKYLDEPCREVYRRMMFFFQRLLETGALARARTPRWALSVTEMAEREYFTTTHVAAPGTIQVYSKP